MVVQHTGWVNYTRTQIGMIPAEGIGMVAFSNATSSSLHTALCTTFSTRSWVIPMPTGARNFSRRTSPMTTTMIRARLARRGTKPSLDPAHFAGAYVDPLYGDVEVKFIHGRLVLRYSDEYVADLEHWHHDTFRATWRPTGFGSTIATFSLGHEGRANPWTSAASRRSSDAQMKANEYARHRCT